jgi:hypothetical protein
MDGDLCPEFVDEPRTVEGLAVLAVCDRPGVWIRTGLRGLIAGLDLVGAIASLPAHCDRARARRLFLSFESAYVGALIERETKESARDGQR